MVRKWVVGPGPAHHLLKKKRMRYLLFTVLLPFFGQQAMAQYYYKDIVINKQLMAEMALLKAQKIHTIKVKSFDREDEPSIGFYCEKKINKNFSKFETVTKSYATPGSILTSYFNGNGQLEESIDSTEISVGYSRYGYDHNGNLVSIESGSRSSDEDYAVDANETHRYYYNNQNQLQKLVKLKNNKDSVVILFVLDEKGNVIEERNTVTKQSYYYYYDAKNRLTDIVYFNNSLRKLLPVTMFEYNGLNQITQMVTAEEGSLFYYTWKYTYENGLKLREKCYYNKKGDPLIREGGGGYAGPRNLQGIIEYTYK
jgi:hypothetical protein